MNLRPVLDASPNAIVAVDASGLIVSANLAVHTMFGWSPAELMGASVERLVPPQLVERHVAARMRFVAARAGRPVGMGLGFTGRRRDGSEFPVEIGLVTVEAPDGPLVFATVVDRSDRKALRELNQTNEELRHQVIELVERGQQMALLAEVREYLDAAQSIEEAYAVLSRSAPALFSGDAGVVYELVAPGGGVEAVVAWGDPPPVVQVFAPTDCWALRRGRTHAVDDDGGELRCAHVEEPVGAGLLCVPMAAQSETIGVLHVQFRRRVPRARRNAVLADRRQLAETLAEHVALALANIRLRAALREQSVRDKLTGLFNRRYMEESLHRELRRATREGYGLGLIMADLDHFKSFNDQYGHAAGDVVLQRIGRFLGEAVRGEDVACRYGGEEFVIILPRARLEDTRHRAEALREGLRSLREGLPGQPLPGVTMSFGVAAFPEHGASGDQLLAAVDAALYRAKAAGRDRVVVAGIGARQAIEVAAETDAAKRRRTAPPR